LLGGRVFLIAWRVRRSPFPASPSRPAARCRVCSRRRLVSPIDALDALARPPAWRRRLGPVVLQHGQLWCWKPVDLTLPVGEHGGGGHRSTVASVPCSDFEVAAGKAMQLDRLAQPMHRPGSAMFEAVQEGSQPSPALIRRRLAAEAFRLPGRGSEEAFCWCVLLQHPLQPVARPEARAPAGRCKGFAYRLRSGAGRRRGLSVDRGLRTFFGVAEDFARDGQLGSRPPCCLTSGLRLLASRFRS